MKRVHLELGGKAPMVVLDDADPATVAEAIKIGGYFNSGQDCTASSRILVSERIYDDVLSATVEAVESLTVGDPGTDDEIGMGPVISAEQQERVLGFLERATDAKATIVTGGESIGDRGFFVKPAIVTDVDQKRRDRAERGLRPGRDHAVRGVRRRRDRDGERRALRPGGLGVLGERRAGDEGRGEARVRHRLGQRAPLPARSEMPHGGFKESGYGKDMSIYSMEEYTRIKHVCVKLAE